MLKGTSLEVGYYRLLERRLVPFLAVTGIKPDHLSVLGLLISLVAGFAFAFYPLIGGLLTLVTGLLDTLDGSLARSTGQSRKFGAFLDSVLDRYTELVIYIGVWFYFYRQGSTSPAFYLTFLLILFGSLMVSYTRARAEGLGERCMGGIFQRGERIILIALAGIFNPLVNRLMDSHPGHWMSDIVLVVVLMVLAVGTNLTAIWRFLNVLRNLKP
ncbi:MAG: CDP-alcohol phosphatidyltransferase family protein [Syntrophobacteraceae bacterium]|jgi:CDP-diacylglycerol--glycerol-3-phosphate 3-phosphatidyltransferase|nr:CDP-alcohol phosphatidyltransferase family protein [Syntrophobacteraceae bacterium]